MDNCKCVFENGATPKIVQGYGFEIDFQLTDDNNIPVPLDTATEITLSLTKSDGTALTMKLSDSSGISVVNAGKYGQFKAVGSPTNSASLALGPGDGLTDMFATYTIPAQNNGNPVPLELKSSVYIIPPSLEL